MAGSADALPAPNPPSADGGIGTGWGESDGLGSPQGISQDLYHEPDILIAFVLSQVVGDVHDAGRAAGGNQVHLGFLDVLDLVIVNLDGGVVVCDAVTAGRTTAGVGVLHLDKFNPWDHFQ